MAEHSGLAEHLLEQLAPLGPVTVRRMFGGAGLFLDGVMFGLIADDVLFFKVDAASRADFEAEGLGPFTYEKSTGQAVMMSYWRAPERLLDEDDEMRAWALKAIAAARRGARAKADAPRARKAAKAAPPARRGKR